MTLRRFFHSLSLALPPVLLLAACQGYDITINERTVYTPRPLFRDFDIADEALRTCLQETIATDSISAAARLGSLNCSHAGIESLEGLSTFTGLKVLRLSSNRIKNLVELGRLPLLRELYLDENLIVDPVPLQQLEKLTYLDLAGNAELQCPGEGNLADITTVILPEHCR